MGRLSRNSSFAAEVGKINRELARGGSLVFDIEAQAQRHNSLPSHTEVPHSAPARHSTLPLQLASVPSQGGQPYTRTYKLHLRPLRKEKMIRP